MTPKPNLVTMPLGRLLDTPMPPRQPLLSPWLREQESALVWAAPGVGKTMLTLSIALAVAGGGSFLGWSAPRPRRVLLIDGEMPKDDLQGRLRSLAGSVEGLDLEAARVNLSLLARHAQDPDAAFPDFGDLEQHDRILDLIRGAKPDLLILDNLSTLATLADENAASQTQHVVKLLTRLKQAGIAVVVVHHSGKSGAHYRGSSMLATTFEVILGLTRDRAQDVLDESGCARFDIRWDKYRNRRDPSVVERTVRLEETPGGLSWLAMAQADEVLHALAGLVRSGQFRSQKDVGRALPPRLWPNDTPPSEGWISRQFKLAKAKGVISEGEIKAYFEAADDDPALDLESPLHDDI